MPRISTVKVLCYVLVKHAEQKRVHNQIETIGLLAEWDFLHVIAYWGLHPPVNGIHVPFQEEGRYGQAYKINCDCNGVCCSPAAERRGLSCPLQGLV